MLHSTPCSVASFGYTVAVNVTELLPSGFTHALVGSNSILSTGIFTIILHVALFPLPSVAVAVITVFPTVFAVTFPIPSTTSISATSGLLLIQSNSLFSASSGVIVGVISNFYPCFNDLDAGFNVIPFTFNPIVISA